MTNDPYSTAPPPQLARHLFELVTPAELSDALLGDLEEEFHWRAARDSDAARRWYVSQLSHSAVPLLTRRLARPMGALAAGSAAAVASSLALGLLIQLGASVLLASEESTAFGEARLAAPLALVMALAAVCAFMASTCGGYVSRCIGGELRRGVLVALGAIVLAPELVHGVQLVGNLPLASVILPVGIAALATGSGLRLGGRLHAHYGSAAF